MAMEASRLMGSVAVQPQVAKHAIQRAYHLGHDAMAGQKGWRREGRMAMAIWLGAKGRHGQPGA